MERWPNNPISEQTNIELNDKELTDAQFQDLIKYFNVITVDKNDRPKDKKELEEEIDRLAEQLLNSSTGRQIEKKYSGILTKIAKGGRLSWLKKMLIIIPLLAVEPVFSSAYGQEKKRTTDVSQINKKFEKDLLAQDNEKLLLEGEHVVDEEIMKAYANSADPNSIGDTPAGGYFSKNYLDRPEEYRSFLKKMKKLGYDHEEIEKINKYFNNQNIVFNRAVLLEKNFTEILAHERLHQAIDRLPAKDQETLNAARDYIINDYKEKENICSTEIDKLLINGELKMDDVPQKQRELMEKIGLPILNTDNSWALIQILRNPNEFYTYLMMGRLNQGVSDYLKNNFPEANLIYEILKNKIYSQIEGVK